MCNESGYIKLYRGILTSPVWSKPTYAMWWIELLLSASWKTTSKQIGNLTIVLSPGQLALTITEMTELFKYQNIYGDIVKPSRKTIVNFISFLEENNLISRDFVGGNKYTVITIRDTQSVDSSTTTATSPATTVVLPQRTKPKKSPKSKQDTVTFSEVGGSTKGTDNEITIGSIDRTDIGFVEETNIGSTKETDTPDIYYNSINKEEERNNKKLSSLREESRASRSKKESEIFSKIFFSEENTPLLDKLCKKLGFSLSGFEELKELAGEILNEWELTHECHSGYNDWSSHLVRVINKKVADTSRRQNYRLQPTKLHTESRKKDLSPTHAHTLSSSHYPTEVTPPPSTIQTEEPTAAARSFLKSYYSGASL